MPILKDREIRTELVDMVIPAAIVIGFVSVFFLFRYYLPDFRTRSRATSTRTQVEVSALGSARESRIESDRIPVAGSEQTTRSRAERAPLAISKKRAASRETTETKQTIRHLSGTIRSLRRLHAALSVCQRLRPINWPCGTSLRFQIRISTTSSSISCAASTRCTSRATTFRRRWP